MTVFPQSMNDWTSGAIVTDPLRRRPAGYSTSRLSVSLVGDGQRVGELAEEVAVPVAAEGHELPRPSLPLEELARVERCRVARPARRSGPPGDSYGPNMLVGSEDERSGLASGAEPLDPLARVVFGLARHEDRVPPVDADELRHLDLREVTRRGDRRQHLPLDEIERARMRDDAGARRARPAAIWR